MFKPRREIPSSKRENPHSVLTIFVMTNSIGKGFAGVMKRHNFSGLKATHGVSLTHRSQGSTGQHQDPGRVFPGKKMAGHMGNSLHTTQNLLLMRVDNMMNLLYIAGAVPGPKGGVVKVTDSFKKAVGKNKKAAKYGVQSLPWPAGTEQMEMPDELVLDLAANKA